MLDCPRRLINGGDTRFNSFRERMFRTVHRYCGLGMVLKSSFLIYIEAMKTYLKEAAEKSWRKRASL
jgi:hypothetical protein